jgi:hypothetical protein
MLPKEKRKSYNAKTVPALPNPRRRLSSRRRQLQTRGRHRLSRHQREVIHVSEAKPRSDGRSEALGSRQLPRSARRRAADFSLAAAIFILETAPGIEESLKSKMPYYEYHGMLCAFASQKNYMSFYILNGEVVEKHRDLLRGLSVGKGCIRFRRLSEIGEGTIRKLLHAAAEANEAVFNDHC